MGGAGGKGGGFGGTKKLKKPKPHKVCPKDVFVCKRADRGVSLVPQKFMVTL